MRNILLPLCLALFISEAVSQQVVSVDKSTGRALASIPIWTLNERNLSVPISLYYENGSGVQVGSGHTFLGLGWGITDGGSVSRQLNGLPDDYVGTGADERKGWLAAHNSSIVADYIHNLNLSGTSEDNQTILKTLYNSSDELILDTEPDVFSVDAPGLSLQFVFDKFGQPQDFPNSHSKIDAIKAPDGTITRFVITNAAGNKYHFDRKVEVQKQTIDLDLVNAEGFFKNEYDSYKDQITYTSEWKLSKIESYYTGQILFSYVQDNLKTSTSEVELYIRQDTLMEGYEEKKIFKIDTEYTPLRLVTISTSSGQRVDFIVEDGELDRIDLSDERRPDSFIKSFEFTYEDVDSDITSGFIKYLRRVQEVSSCDKYPPYVFTYNNEANFPAEQSNSIDYWGYFNAANNDHLFPSLDVYPDETLDKNKVQLHRDVVSANKFTLTGADRKPNPSTVAHAMLEEVQLPMGDKIRISYEANTYFDSFLNQEVIGAGARVKLLNRFANRISGLANEVINFYYTADQNNFLSGASSGKISSNPKYHIVAKDYVNGATTLSYATLTGGTYTVEQRWQYLTARSAQSMGDVSQVLYSDVIERKSGENGFRVSKFLLPPTEDSVDPLWANYSETTIALGKSVNCASIGMTSTGGGVFPYAPATRSASESVLTIREDIVDNTFRLLNRQENLYQQLTFNNGNTRGIKLEVEPNGCGDLSLLFGSYNITHGVQYVMDQAKSLTYEFDGTTNDSLESTSDYYYDGFDHMYPTSVISTDVEGNEFKNETVFPSDYIILGAAEGSLENAIEKLVIDNRLSVPVESVVSQKLVGETGFSVTGGSYKTFKKISEKVVLATSQALVLGQPLSSFQLSNHTTGSLSPNGQYETRMVYTSYDDDFRLTRVDDPISRTHSSTIWNDELQTVALQLVDAAVSEVFFSNFSTVSPSGSVLVHGVPSSNPVVSSGRNDASSLKLTSGTKLSGSFTKANDGYLISFWSKVTSAPQAVTLRLELKNSASGSVIDTHEFQIANDGEWEFYSKSIDLSGLGSSVYFDFSWPFLGSDVTLVDDFLLAPANSAVSSQIIEFPYGVSSATNHISGQSSVTFIDNLGRTQRIEDSRGNTRKLFKYEYANLPPVAFTTSIRLPNKVFENRTVVFEATEVCLDNVTYEWAFKPPGVTPVEADYQDTGQSVTKSFSTVGQMKAHLRIKKSGFTTYDATPRTFSVLQEVLSVDACVKGKLGLDLCGNYQTLPQDCSNITGTPSNDFEVLYGVDAVSGGDGTYTYKWLKRNIGATNWTEIIPPVSGQIAICQTDNYEIKLEATDGQGRTGESQTFTVAHYLSNPGCTTTTSTCN